MKCLYVGKLLLLFVIQTFQSFEQECTFNYEKIYFHCSLSKFITFTGCPKIEGKMRKNKLQINNRSFSFEASFLLKIENLSSVFANCSRISNKQEIILLVKTSGRIWNTILVWRFAFERTQFKTLSSTRSLNQLLTKRIQTLFSWGWSFKRILENSILHFSLVNSYVTPVQFRISEIEPDIYLIHTW